MTLKRQLMFVSLLTLMLPWAGCQFIRETESALRASQQQMLAGTAQAIADSMSQYAEEFPLAADPDFLVGDQLYGHRLARAPAIDGYFEDWTIGSDALATLRGTDGPVEYALGIHGPFVYLFVKVIDRSVVYADAASLMPVAGSRHADRVRLVSENPPYLEESLTFTAEAPGPLVTYVQNANGFAPEPTVRAIWQDVPRGYQLEARIPASLLGTHLGLVVENTDSADRPAVASATFSARAPGAFVTVSPALAAIASERVQPGMRLIVTDAAGWRIASAGDLRPAAPAQPRGASNWLRVAYDALVDPGEAATFAEPDPSGREQQPYVTTALGGETAEDWFRAEQRGRAIVAVAAPIRARGRTIGAVVLQQGTDAILSLTNEGLSRLLNLTLIATLIVAAALLGYASWLSRRIRRLSIAAEAALESNRLGRDLPDARSADEIGALSRSFSSVLSQLGDYNEYLRTLASKLSHELRTPLAIVTSSLENLEHEALGDPARGYTARAKDGAERLRRILGAMSEASRVEELMQSGEPERFDLAGVLRSTVGAYRDAFPARRFRFDCDTDTAEVEGVPELVIQMLDKLVDNAVSFSGEGDEIAIALSGEGERLRLDVTNPGPPLPEKMRAQLFDSMISMRAGGDDRHLGLGLYIAKLIADGHGGRIDADNTEDGVRFSVWLPRLAHT